MSLSVAACHRGQASPELWPSATVQANQALVIGRVTSSRGGRPLGSAVVQLLTPDGQLVASVRSDERGAFVLGPAAPAVYQLKIRMIVHRPLTTTLDLRAGVIDTLRLRLAYDETGMIADCIGPERPDGTRGSGSQFCRL